MQQELIVDSRFQVPPDGVRFGVDRQRAPFERNGGYERPQPRSNRGPVDDDDRPRARCDDPASYRPVEPDSVAKLQPTIPEQPIDSLDSMLMARPFGDGAAERRERQAAPAQRRECGREHQSNPSEVNVR